MVERNASFLLRPGSGAVLVHGAVLERQVRSRAAYENGLRLAREAKRKRTGTCRVCGTTTRYNGKGKAVSDICLRCAAKETGAKVRGKKGHRQGALRALMADGVARRHGEIAQALGLSNLNYMSQLIDRGLEHGYIERVSRGVYRKVAE